MAESGDLVTLCRRCYHLPPARIGMLRFLVEGYDGILFLRTLEARAAVVELSWPKSCSVDAEAILTALCLELNMAEEESM